MTVAAPLQPPRDLTIPEPGSTTARAILSRAIGRLMRELPVLARDASVPELLPLVQGALRSAPGAVASALRRPTVGALVRCLRYREIPNRGALWVELTALLALELALAGALPAPLRLARWPRRWLSIPGRLAISLPENTTSVTVENGLLRVEHPGGAAVIDLEAPRTTEGIVVEHPYRAITGGIALALEDNNPLALEEAHPDKSGNAIDVGGREPAQWIEAIGAAFATIGEHLPDLHAEMQLYIQQVVPVGWHDVQHLSASYQEAIGTIYMTLHPGHMTLVEALIHEFSHNKLNALFEIDGVLENAWSPLYASPVRPDPRPLHGVLLAVHAFLPVARLYEQMVEADDPRSRNDAFRGRFAAVRAINREGAELILRVAQPTALGRGLIDEIRRWDEHYAAFDRR